MQSLPEVSIHLWGIDLWAIAGKVRVPGSPGTGVTLGLDFVAPYEIDG